MEEKMFPKSRVKRIVERALEIGERKAMDRFNIPLLRLNACGIIEKVNKKATTSFSTPEHELVGKHVTDLLQADPSDHEAILADVAKAVKQAQPGETIALPPTLVMRRDPSGEPIESIARFSVYRPVKGKPRIYVSMTHTRRVLQQSRLLKDFFDLADTINSQNDLDKVLQSIADHFADRFNAAAIVVRPNGGNTLKLAAFAGKGILPADFLSFHDIPIGKGLIGKAAESLSPIEVPNIREWPESVRPDIDEKYGFTNSIAVPLTIKGADGKPVLVGVIGLFKGGEHAKEKFRPHERRMLEVLAGNTATAIHKARLTKELKFMAERDFLTGVFNRRVFFHSLRDYLNANPPGSKEFHPAIERKRFSVFFVDANNLKLLNDTHGYAQGNTGLKMIASALQKHAPKNAVVARLGGDEFGVFVPDVDMPASDAFLEKVRKEVSEGVQKNDEMRSVGFGVAIDYMHFGAGGKSERKYKNLYDLLDKDTTHMSSFEEHSLLDSLMQLAEEKMKAAKKSARSQQHVFIPRLVEDLAARTSRGELSPEHEKKFLELLAAHAGQAVYDQYAKAKASKDNAK